jgi:glyceraldehyde 3-phosphate dehydrogenase
MSIKIGINGIGRIGKMVLRYALNFPEIEVVHLNDKMSPELMAHLLKYDSIHGQYDANIEYTSSHLIVNGKKILVTDAPIPSDIPWHRQQVDIVVDASGKFKTASLLKLHLVNQVKKVILSAPPADNSIDKSVVMGVNHTTLTDDDILISNTSCTTNCVALMLKILHQQFGIKQAFMNTIHPATNNQNIQDGYHTDFRRARGVLNNIIPTTSSAVVATKLVLPEMEGVFDGIATRVPIADCSFVEIVARLEKECNVETVNASFRNAAENELADFIEYSEIPLVSSDITNNRSSLIFDALATKVLPDNMVQIIAWYDNECGYSARIIDLIHYISRL